MLCIRFESFELGSMLLDEYMCVVKWYTMNTECINGSTALKIFVSPHIHCIYTRTRLIQMSDLCHPQLTTLVNNNSHTHENFVKPLITTYSLLTPRITPGPSLSASSRSGGTHPCLVRRSSSSPPRSPYSQPSTQVYRISFVLSLSPLRTLTCF